MHYAVKKNGVSVCFMFVDLERRNVSHNIGEKTFLILQNSAQNNFCIF